MKMSGKTGGFTLLELLIAMAIFGLLSIMTFSGINSVVNTRQQLEHELDRLAEVQRSLLTLSRDLAQIIDRKGHDELGGEKPAISGGQNIDSTLFEFTRLGWRNPANLPRSNLQRVAYALEENQLIRLYWYHPDPTQTDEPVKRVLLKNVENVTVRFLDSDWQNSWPPVSFNAGEEVASLPRAIEVVITLRDWGEIRRLFRVNV